MTYDRKNDRHIQDAARIFNVPEDEVTSAQRAAAKEATFWERLERKPSDLIAGLKAQGITQKQIDKVRAAYHRATKKWIGYR